MTSHLIRRAFQMMVVVLYPRWRSRLLTSPRVAPSPGCAYHPMPSIAQRRRPRPFESLPGPG
jgi:hypothetical protein